MNAEEDKSTAEKLARMMTRNFSITKCPDKVYKEFVEFCQEETNDNYSMGIKLLLDARKANIKEVILFEQYMELKSEFQEFREKLLVKDEKPKKKLKTFGG